MHAIVASLVGSTASWYVRRVPELSAPLVGGSVVCIYLCVQATYVVLRRRLSTHLGLHLPHP